VAWRNNRNGRSLPLGVLLPDVNQCALVYVVGPVLSLFPFNQLKGRSDARP
jgi:hypothetical protein